MIFCHVAITIFCHGNPAPTRWRYQRAAVQNAVAGDIEGVSARVCDTRDLILLKMIAAPNRPELDARRADEAEITGL